MFTDAKFGLRNYRGVNLLILLLLKELHGFNQRLSLEFDLVMNKFKLLEFLFDARSE